MGRWREEAEVEGMWEEIRLSGRGEENTSLHSQKTLGMGSGYAHGQSSVFLVLEQMDHSEHMQTRERVAQKGQ